MEDPVEPIANGMLGRFWALVDGQPVEPSSYGFVRRDDDGFWQVDVQSWPAESGIEIGIGKVPSALVGVLSNGPVFLSDARTWNRLRRSGQSLDTLRVRYETLVTGPDVNKVEAEGVVEAEAVFPRMVSWASHEMPDWRYRGASESLGEGFSFDIGTYPKTVLDIDDGRKLTIQVRWQSDWQQDELRVPFGLGLKVTAGQPMPTKAFVETLELLQDLVSLCWNGRVPTLPGEGRVHLGQKEAGRFSSKRLLDSAPITRANLDGVPIVYLRDLGGPEAFGRWLELSCKYPRASRAVREGLYVGASTEVMLLNVAAAIAYWVTSNRREHEWAALKQSRAQSQNEIRRLVMHQLPVFGAWVGDGEEFSRRLHDDYNALKHDPTFEIDYRLVSRFSHTARIMLVGSMLDRLAGTRVPSERLAAYFWSLGNEVKELLFGPELSAVLPGSEVELPPDTDDDHEPTYD